MLRRHPAQGVSPFASLGGAIARSSRQVLFQRAILRLLRAKGALCRKGPTLGEGVLTRAGVGKAATRRGAASAL